MFKVKFIGGPLGGTTEERNFVPRDLLFRSPRGNGTYVRTEFDTELKAAAMKWEAAKGHPCPDCRKKGYTLIEFLIVIAIVGILTAAYMSAAKGRTRCVGGYLHSIDYNSSLRQIVDDQGRGIKCEMKP